MNKLKPKSRWSIVLGIACVLSGSVAVYAMTRPTLESSGRRLVDCILRGDAECAMEYASEEEVKLGGLTELKLASLLNIVQDKLATFKATGPTRTIDGITGQTLTAGVDMVDGKVRTTSWAVSMYRGDSRIECDTLASRILNAAAFVRRVDDPTSGPDVIRNFVARLDEMMAELETLELEGVVNRRGPERMFKFETWRDRRDYAARILAQWDQHGANP